jgi:hypothetical protein
LISFDLVFFDLLLPALIWAGGLDNTFLKGFVSRLSVAADFNNSVA